jgi:hypothetical protein
MTSKSPQREAVRKQIKAPIRVFFGFDELDDIKQLKARNEPFLFVDHAYFDRGYERGNFRVALNNIHQTKVYDYPDDRRKKFGVKVRDWKVYPEGRILFIPSPPNPMTFHKEPKWNDEAIDQLVRNTKREIHVKSQKTKGLGEFLDHCFCLVSHCSVAAVEAACHGIPVAVSEHNPARSVGVDLSQIESPIYPDRTQWVNTLTYSQFSIDEFKDGSAWQIVKEMNNL